MTTDNSSPLPADASVSELPSAAAASDEQSPQTAPEQAAAPSTEENIAAAGAVPQETPPAATAEASASPATPGTPPPPDESASTVSSSSGELSSDAGESAASSGAPEASLPAQASAPAEEVTPPAETAPSDSPADATDENASSQPESTDRPPEKTRRRVQLKPTYSPEIAKPVPSIVTPPTPEPTRAEAASADQAQQPSGDESSDETSSPAAAPAGAVPAGTATGDQPEPNKAAERAEGASAPSPQPAAEPVALPPKNEQLDADIEAELNAALSGDTSAVPDADAATNEMADLDKAADAIAVPADEDVTRGARLSGTVQSIHGDDMFVDFGLRMPGVLSRRQFGLRKQPMQGEAITVIVNRIDEKEGLIHVNLPSGASRVRGNWDELSVDQTVECQVNQTNKGGLEVSVGSLRGFMPASQVELGYVADLNVYVGQKLRARITEVNPKRRKLVLSRRSLLEAEREVTEKDFFEKVAPGQTYQGRVKTIKDYGAFVDIGGVDGLLHVGQISWSRINHPSDVLTPGQEIEVKVLSVDPEKKKIGLGMRQLSPNPWQTAEEKYPSGTVVKGKVTRIETFGGFVELEPGVEGLVHISQLDHQRIKSVQEVLRVGQEVDVQVLEVDPTRKRISLSVKALKEKPEEPAEPEAPPVQRVDPQSLKGGIGDPTGGQLFGDPGRFGS